MGTVCINSEQEKAAFPWEQFLNLSYSFLQFPIHLLLIKIQTNKQKKNPYPFCVRINSELS